MDILSTIAAFKRKEVSESRRRKSEAALERSTLFHSPVRSLAQSLGSAGSSGIIAEFKRKSPSKGWIRPDADVRAIATGYEAAGAAGISVLTDAEFFGGSAEDLLMAREAVKCPVLRKDFIVDPWQVVEARSMGADVILLIAAVLTPEETYELARMALSLGMETLLEVHSVNELDHLNGFISLLGVNNRNLADFKVDIGISLNIAGHLPKGIPTVSESGLGSPADILRLREAGFSGFLIGESFMSAPDPAAACRAFVSATRNNQPS